MEINIYDLFNEYEKEQVCEMPDIYTIANYNTIVVVCYTL